MRDQSQTMDVIANSNAEFNLTGTDLPVRLTGTSVSANWFQVLGSQAAIGRTFQDGEDQPGNDNVVVLSHSLWERRFGSDPNIIGRSIILEGESRQVVGVMPADFRYPSSKTELWVPLRLDPRKTREYWGDSYMHNPSPCSVHLLRRVLCSSTRCPRCRWWRSSARPTSGDAALATATALAGKVCKTPVLVKDARLPCQPRADPVPGRSTGDGDRGDADHGNRHGHEGLGHADGAVRVARRDRAGRSGARPAVAGERTSDTRVPPAVGGAGKGLAREKSGRGFYVHAKGKKKAKGGLQVNEELGAMMRARRESDRRSRLRGSGTPEWGIGMMGAA